MIKTYKSVNVEIVNSNFILINNTRERILYFDILILCPLILVLTMFILNYNHQNLFEITLTFLLLITTVTLNIFKEKLCNETFQFNRIEKKVIYKKNPKTDKIYNFSEVDITYNTINDNNGSRYKIYLIQIKKSNIKYRLFKDSHNSTFDIFINKYMESDKEIIKNLVNYNKNKII